MPTVYITAPPEAAPDIARSLVEERLAACVNRVDCDSTYRWERQVIEDAEVVLLAKTIVDRYPALADHVHEKHPYDVPCIERFDEADADDALAEWLTESVA